MKPFYLLIPVIIFTASCNSTVQNTANSNLFELPSMPLYKDKITFKNQLIISKDCVIEGNQILPHSELCSIVDIIKNSTANNYIECKGIINKIVCNGEMEPIYVKIQIGEWDKGIGFELVKYDQKWLLVTQWVYTINV